MERLTITVRTLSPVVMTAAGHAVIMTGSQDFISGSAVRGVLAGEYIRAGELGRNAHEDKDFRRLFFDRLRFVDAYPVKDGERAFYLPLSLEKDKAGTTMVDRLREEPGQLITKSVRGLGIVRGGKVSMAPVRKKISLHISRSGENERLSGKSEDGNIYNYESISRGQTFRGYVLGEREDLERLLTALAGRLDGEGGFECRLGKSRSTQYGACRIEPGKVETIPAVSAATVLDGARKDTVCLRAETPVILVDGSPEAPLHTMEACLDGLKGEYSIGQMHVRLVDVDNFVGVWGLRKPRETALCPGTAFAIRKNGGDWTEAELETLQQTIHKGVGQRCEEGFGQLRFWKPAKLEMAEERAEAETPARRQICSEEVRRIADDILLKRVAARVRGCAREDAGRAYNIAFTGLEGQEISGSFFGKLSETLDRARKQPGSIVENFRLCLKQDLEGGAQKRSEKLNSICLHSRMLKDWLLESGTLPVPDGMNWKKRYIGDSELLKMMEELGVDDIKERLYSQYWTWFFRHGRKQNIIKGADRG